MKHFPTKKACILFLFFVLLCRFLYPHTRFGYEDKWSTGFHGRLNIESATLKPGDRITVKVVGIKKMATYSTSDFRIASVTPLGTVYAIRSGTAIISVRQGESVYKCRITVDG